MTKAQWDLLHGPTTGNLGGSGIYAMIGQDLRFVERLSGFNRYRALGILYDRIAAESARRGSDFYDGFPDFVLTLIGQIVAEMPRVARLVQQNEFATISNGAPNLIFSTGFFACLGIVIHDSTRQVTTLGHMAPGCAAEPGMTAIIEDFVAKGGQLASDGTEVILFGGRETDKGREKRTAVADVARARDAQVRHVSLADMGVDHGYGFYFNTVDGTYSVIRERLHMVRVNGRPEMSLVSDVRHRRNERNNARSQDAAILPAE